MAARRSTTGATRTSTWPPCFDKAEAMATLMDRPRLRHVLDGRAPLPARRLRVHPERADDGAAPGAPHQAPQASAAASTSRRCGTRCGSPRTTRWPTSSPAAASRSGSAAATTPARSRPSARRCCDQEANRELFEEQVEIIFKAFNEESLLAPGQALHAAARGAVSRLHAEGADAGAAAAAACRSSAGSRSRAARQRALEFMAKHGIQGMVGGGSAEGGAMHKVVLAWQAAHAKLGKQIELGERLCFGFHFFIADSREQGMQEAAKYYEENMKMFGELRLVRALSEEQIEIMRDPKRAPTAKLPRIEDAVQGRRLPVRQCRRPDRAHQGAREEIPGARPHLGQPVGRRAGKGRLGAAGAVCQRSDAGIQGRQGAPAGVGALIGRVGPGAAPPPSRLRDSHMLTPDGNGGAVEHGGEAPPAGGHGLGAGRPRISHDSTLNHAARRRRIVTRIDCVTPSPRGGGVAREPGAEGERSGGAA